MPFIPAGFPNLETTAACLLSLEQAGASLIEIGFPFSDPIADGPVIQEAFTHALQNHVRVTQVFETVRAVRSRISIPLVAMVSYSIVYRFGLQRFASGLCDSGFSGLILPDLPPPEAESVCRAVRATGIDTILLVAPTTPPDRRTEIARLSSGFVYYLSVAGTTGERNDLPANLAANVQELKSIGDVPVCVGFGIHRPEQVRQLAGVADGAIIGSAIVRRIREHQSESPQAGAHAVAEYCRSLTQLDAQ